MSQAKVSPSVEIGLELYEDKSVFLKNDGLTAHTAIIAQSGSGKSFMLGRLLEEIAGKTMARIMILDPNSDFVQFQKANIRDGENKGAWRRKGAVHSLEDTQEQFQRRWNKVTFRVLTLRDPVALGDPDRKTALPVNACSES